MAAAAVADPQRLTGRPPPCGGRLIRRLGLGVAVLGAVVALGPRAHIDATVVPVALPADLDRYLADQEARFDDLVPDTHKRIVWARPATRTRTPWSVVYLHGFSATRQETAPLCQRVAKALGANLYEARLRGHGRGPGPMGAARLRHWMQDGVEAIAIGRRLGERVLLIGVSTGATLATALAARGETAGVDALVFLAPNFAVRGTDPRILLWPWAPVLAPLLHGETHHWPRPPQNERHARYWTTSYPTRVAFELAGLLDVAAKCDVGAIRTPLLVFQAPGDLIVDAAATHERFAAFGSSPKQLVPIVGADDLEQHVLAGDILSPSQTGRVTAYILRFVGGLPE